MKILLLMLFLTSCTTQAPDMSKRESLEIGQLMKKLEHFK